MANLNRRENVFQDLFDFRRAFNSKVKNERKEADYVQSEMMYGYFERTIPLPEGIDNSKVDAEYHNGVLEILCSMSVQTTSFSAGRRISTYRGPAAQRRRRIPPSFHRMSGRPR